MHINVLFHCIKANTDKTTGRDRSKKLEEDANLEEGVKKFLKNPLDK